MSRIAADRMPSRRRFAPGWPLWVFTLFFMPILLSLGVWQLDRAEQKRQLEAQVEHQRQQAPVPLGDLPDAIAPPWQSLLLTGKFDPERVWLLDNRTRNGQAGVEVLQLFEDQPSGLSLVINRGWLAWPDRRQLPPVPTPASTLQLQAEVLPDPGPGFRLRGSAASGWPRMIIRVEPPILAEQAGVELQPWIARLQPGSPAALRLEWPALGMSATKHTGYAVQWFALAVALLILFIWAGYHRPEPRGNNNNDKHD